jgi:hypothetical protein
MQSIDDETNEEMWPTLNEAHHGVVDIPVVDGWETIVSSDEAIEIKILPPGLRKLRHCASSPDLRFIGNSLAAVEEDDDDEDFSFVSEAESSAVSSAVMVDAPSTSSRTVKRIPSFRDAILLKTSNEQTDTPSSAVQARPKKVKPKIVVTPIKRCARSTGDLRSLVIHEEVLGESDAMDYYHRKAQGASGHMNSLKLRPDEAKRKHFTLQKKKMQRESKAVTD